MSSSRALSGRTSACGCRRKTYGVLWPSGGGKTVFVMTVSHKARSRSEAGSRLDKRAQSLVKPGQVVFIIEKMGRDAEVSLAGCYGDTNAAQPGGQR